MEARGLELEPLVESDVTAAIEYFRRCEVQAIAVSLLWSIVNPAHELRIREIIAREWPEVPVTLSHEVNPIPREYRRTISAAIDASLYPVVSSYTTKLSNALRAAGYSRDLLIANCVGGRSGVFSRKSDEVGSRQSRGRYWLDRCRAGRHSAERCLGDLHHGQSQHDRRHRGRDDQRGDRSARELHDQRWRGDRLSYR